MAAKYCKLAEDSWGDWTVKTLKVDKDLFWTFAYSAFVGWEKYGKRFTFSRKSALQAHDTLVREIRAGEAKEKSY